MKNEPGWGVPRLPEIFEELLDLVEWSYPAEV